MMARVLFLALVGAILMGTEIIEAKPPQVFREKLRWPSSPNSYFVEELDRHGFVQNGEFVKSKIDDEFSSWKQTETVQKIVQGFKECANDVIASGRNGDLNEFIKCLDKNEKVKLLHNGRAN